MVQIGVIGTGGMGGRHARNLANKTPGAKVVAVMDIDQERAKAVAAECGGATVYTDAKAMIADPAVQAVVVAETGVKLDNGIVVDEYCQTNIEGIYAAGDVARHYHPLIGRHIRVEHYQNAIAQGQAAARSMLGQRQPYAEVHWFWSDQYDYNIQYAGFHGEWDQFVVRGSLEQRDFIGFYLKDHRIGAAVAINRPKDLRLTMPLIQAKIQVDAKNLADESVKLRSLLPRE